MGWREQRANLQRTTVRTFSGGDLFDYTPSGLALVAGIEGVFTEPHNYVDVRTQQMVSVQQPTIDFRAIDLPREPRRGDLVAAANGVLLGRSWTVSEVEGDGEGIWTVYLLDAP